MIVKAVVAAVIGALFIFFVCVSYAGAFERFYEMTFISNFLTGVLLFVASVVIITTGRDLPHFLYLDGTVLLLTVVCVCSVFAPEETFTSFSIVLHLVDPIIMLIFYFVFCNARGSTAVAVLSALALPTGYYGFMIAFGQIEHKCIYSYFNTVAMAPWKLILFGLAATAFIVFTVLAVMFVNRGVRSLHYNRRAARAGQAQQISEM